MPTTGHATDRSLTDAANLFRRWRAARKRGERIPEELWTAARDSARQHGVSRTSTELGLDYYALKRRLEESAESTTSGAGGRELGSSVPRHPGISERGTYQPSVLRWAATLLATQRFPEEEWCPPIKPPRRLV
jgi:hypothetical protein